MDWENEHLGLSTAHKSSSRKGPRVASNLVNSHGDDKFSLDFLDDSTNESRAGTSRQGPHQHVAPPRARGGWANEEIKSSKKRGTSSSILGLGQKLQSPDRTKSAFDSDDDIPNIPDLDDFAEDDFKPVVPYKASVAMNRVATFKELDAAAPHYLKLDGINLSILANFLDINDDLKMDEDKVMTWDMLFTDVSSRITTAQSKDQIGNEDNNF